MEKSVEVLNELYNYFYGKLDDNQKMAVNMSTEGHQAVLGTAGTGKTWILIAKALKTKIEHPDSVICIVSKNHSNEINCESQIRKALVDLEHEDFAYLKYIHVTTFKDVQNNKEIDYYFVDEANQFMDSEKAEDKMYTWLCSRNNITIACDTVQRTTTFQYRFNLDENNWPKENTVIVDRVYRCKESLLNFSKDIINNGYADADKSKIKNAVAKYADGFKPVVVQTNQPERWILETIQKYRDENGDFNRTIAIVYPFNASEIEERTQFLLNPSEYGLSDEYKVDYYKQIWESYFQNGEVVGNIVTDFGVNVVGIHNVSGLEFDTVIIPDIGAYFSGDNSKYTKMFVAFTRAKQQLYIIEDSNILKQTGGLSVTLTRSRKIVKRPDKSEWKEGESLYFTNTDLFEFLPVKYE